MPCSDSKPSASGSSWFTTVYKREPSGSLRKYPIWKNKTLGKLKAFKAVSSNNKKSYNLCKHWIQLDCTKNVQSVKPLSLACICWCGRELHLQNVQPVPEHAPLLCCQSSCMRFPLVHTGNWDGRNVTQYQYTDEVLCDKIHNASSVKHFPTGFSEYVSLNTCAKKVKVTWNVDTVQGIPDDFLHVLGWLFPGLPWRFHWNADCLWRRNVSCQVFIPQNGCLLGKIHVLHEWHAAFQSQKPFLDNK